MSAEETNDVNVEKGDIADNVDLDDDEILDVGLFFQKCELSLSTNEESTTSNIKDVVEEKDQETKSIPRASKRIRTKFTVSSFYYSVMRQHWAEFCLSIGLLLTVLSSLFHAHYAMKTRLTQRKAPSPVRFFPRNSLVTEFHDGNGLDLHRLLSMQTNRRGSTGVLFVMYYAPWCARSMDARWHLENLSRYFYPNSYEKGDRNDSSNRYGPVHFVAVNCWDPNGQCRRTYKLYTYPVFMAYPGTIHGIYYNGIVSADYMFRFLENVISPLTRLQNEDDAAEFLQDYKTSAIGYFDFTTFREGHGYQQFYAASLKSLERDPLRAAIKFAVVTRPDDYSRLDFDRHGQIKLWRYANETILDFPDDRDYSAKSISTWLFENLANPVRWISPSTAGVGKSDALNEFVTRKPTLILFATRQPLFDLTPHYAKLTEVALRYFDCSHDIENFDINRSVDETLKKLDERQRRSKSNRRRSVEFCLKTLREEVRLLNDCCEDITQTTIIDNGRKSLYDYRQRNICHVCHSSSDSRSPASFCQRFLTSDDFSPAMTLATKEFLTPIFSSRSCDRLINDFLPKSTVIDYCCRRDQKNVVDVERLRKRARSYAEQNLPQSTSTIGGGGGGDDSENNFNCERLRLSRLLRYTFQDERDERDEKISDGDRIRFSSWNGLGCRTNRTLQFAAMDRNFYGAFARKLGLDEKSSTPVAVIFDNLKESVYLFDEPMSVGQLGDFVANFTFGRLARYYRSEIVGRSRTNISAISASSNATCSPNSICIRTVTSATFRSMVMDRSKDVVLFYTARWCGSCQRLFHVYQTLAYYFRVVDTDITFAQMDVTSNDVPWQFTIDNVPALILFPAESKSESAVFPNYAPWTLPNLVAFVLAHCRRETRLRFALSTCLQNTTSRDPKSLVDSRCLIRNRYRTWRQLSRIDRRMRFLRLEIDRAIQASKWDWDHDDNSDEWRVYLQRSWIDVWKSETKRRALRTLLTDALRRNHFEKVFDAV